MTSRRLTRLARCLRRSPGADGRRRAGRDTGAEAEADAGAGSDIPVSSRHTTVRRRVSGRHISKRHIGRQTVSNRDSGGRDSGKRDPGAQDHGPRDPGVPSGGQGFDRRLIAPMVLGAVLNPVNSSMIAVALVPIGAAFGAPPSRTAWLVSTLYLTTAVGQPVVGRLVDLHGPRRLFLTGAALAGVAGLLGALAPSLGVLISARVLLGLGTCAGFPAAMFLIRGEARRTGQDSSGGVLTVLAVASQTVAVIGPALGGLLIGLGGWRAIFLVNVPLSLAALTLGALRLPRLPGAERMASAPTEGAAYPDAGGPGTEGHTTGDSGDTADTADAVDASARSGQTTGAPARSGAAQGTREDDDAPSEGARAGQGTTAPVADPTAARAAAEGGLDLPGIALFTATLTTLLLFLMNPAATAWYLPVLSAGAAVGFVGRELRAARPFIDLRVLGGQLPVLGTFCRTFLAFTVLYAFLYGYTQWLEEGRGLSASGAGLVLLPMFLTAILVATATGRRGTVRGKLVVGGVAQVVACALLAVARPGSGIWLLVAVTVTAGIPQGLIGLANQNALYHQADPARLGSSAGLLRTFMYLGAMAASAASGAFLSHGADTGGLHHLALFMLAGAVLFLTVTLVDRSLRRIGPPPRPRRAAPRP